MLNFKQIENHLRKNMTTQYELKEYYDIVFHGGIFLSEAEFYELNRLFRLRSYLING